MDGCAFALACQSNIDILNSVCFANSFVSYTNCCLGLTVLTAMNVGGKKIVVTKASAFIATLSSPVVAAIVALTLLSTCATRLYSYSS